MHKGYKARIYPAQEQQENVIAEPHYVGKRHLRLLPSTLTIIDLKYELENLIAMGMGTYEVVKSMDEQEAPIEHLVRDEENQRLIL